MIKQNAVLYEFLNPDKQEKRDTMSHLLDQLLSGERTIENIPEKLDDKDIEFLQLGLAYHISRKKNSVRLSTKIIVKNYQKREERKETEATWQETGLSQDADKVQPYLSGQA